MCRHGRQFLFIIILLLAGCSSLVPTKAPPVKDKNLHIVFPNDDWGLIDARTSDHAWSHKKRGDVIVLNSFCGEFQSLPLESLALKTFQSYPGFLPLGKRTIEWFEREAFEMEAEAQVDGVKVLIYMRNYRRNHCYYDFVLITPRQRDPQTYQAFRELLSGVRFK
jgi:hypothetical protein